MLHPISWQQYIAAITLLSATWYTWVALRFYRTEFLKLLRIKSAKNSQVPTVATKQSADVMGAIKSDDNGIADVDELIFSSTETDDISDQTLPKGPSDDLLAEAQALVAVYAETDNKPEFLSFLKILIDKYEVYSEEIDLASVIKCLLPFAKSRLPFSLDESELPLTF